MEGLSSLSSLTITESTVHTTATATPTPNDSPTQSHHQPKSDPSARDGPSAPVESSSALDAEDVPTHESVTPSTSSIPLSTANNAIIILFCRKPDVSFRDFKNILENDWMPCLEKVCGPLFPLTYVRRYIAHKDNDRVREQDGPVGLPSLMIGREEDLLFDCLVEATFEDNLHMLQWFNLINEEEPAQKLLECESTFSDINKLKVIIMENRVTVNKTRRLKTWEE
ncbi:hypothetical protein CC80DRAFT_158852 [Byssothecium circinans]|uniref:EthD domain-containing protein n=1 Tax=Byssothecium circinans TaxID=147558 RepID=A0A6A5UBN7_9PLEO|nr:hypothetical protein CC80DRAFT_158852 [Byssothecium circinans]